MNAIPPDPATAPPRILTLDEFRAESAPYWTPPPYVSKFGGGFIHEFAGRSATRDWLIKGAMLAKTFALVIGQPGCGKSFLMLDYAMTAALCAVRKDVKPEWFGRKIKPCGVVYVSAEGQEDFIFRINAWLAHAGIGQEQLPFYLIPTAVDLCNSPEGAAALADEIAAKSAEGELLFGVPFGIAIVDTVSRALGGGDENSPAAMGAFVKNCGFIKEKCGVAVIGVHHTPQGSERARGHGALHGATDTELVVSPPAEGTPNKWRIGRSKCGPTGAWHEFRLRQHVLGKDDDGDEVTSCIVQPMGGEGSPEEAVMRDTAEAVKTGKRQFTADGRAILPDNLTATVRALESAISENGEFPPVNVRAPHGRRAVQEKVWLDEIVRVMPGKPDEERDGEKFRRRCWDTKAAATLKLTRRGIIGSDNGWVWRTERRVAGVDRAVPEDRPSNSDFGGRISEIDGRKSDSHASALDQLCEF